MHIVADARLVRRVIKRHRGIAGIGLEVPHGHCCLIERDALLRLVSESELGTKRDKLEERVILVARPERDGIATAASMSAEVWRNAFHGHVHHHLDGRVASGDLDEAIIRERIDRIGQTEFDEIRSVLHSEELLFSVKDDREAYVEFAAFYLELRHFAPDAVAKFFPTIRDPRLVEDALAHDVEAAALLARCKPDGAPSLDEIVAAQAGAAIEETLADSSQLPSKEDATAFLAEAIEQRAKGNAARSVVLCGRAALAGAPGAEESAAADLASLAERLHAALHTDAEAAEEAPSIEEWLAALQPLARAAVRESSTRALEARVLHDLQKICVDAERERRTVDVVTWVTSLGRRPIVRPLPVVRVVRIARHLAHAFTSSHRARLTKEDRARLEAVFHRAGARATGNSRRAIKPALESSLDEVGLRPRSVPEIVAREKLCEEVLDQILERGFLGIGQLRDALSRSNLKLPDLSLGALFRGDPLLRADELLSVRLDGVYRRGEIYLRGLQKVSSLAFGTPIGRLFTLHLALPLLAAFVFLEASSHLVHPLAHAFHLGEVHVLTPSSLGGLALFVYALIHSETVRRGVKSFFRGIGRALHAVVIGIPRWVITRPFFRAMYQSAPFALLLRLVLKPMALGAPAFFLARRLGISQRDALMMGGGLVLLTALFLGTSLGYRLEEAMTEIFVRRLRQVGRRILPGAFAFIVDFFRALIEALDRGIYTVDERLTFKTGQSTLALFTKGALGTVWFFVTYVLRIYVNLLIEPQVNPIKHFPVVTVSHKIILPMGPTLLGVMRQPLMPLGPVVANTVAGSTVFLLPGVFGFLVWELKGNWGLYHANRSTTLQPVRIGHHGETMNGLLVMGFHQGTVPKLFAKLRHAARQGRSSVNRYRESLHQVEHALHTFAERELAGLLHASPRWDAGDVEIEKVEVSSNRVRIGVSCHNSPGNTTWIHFEEQSGLLVASVATPGFVDTLGKSDRRTFETALAGLYKLAGVDIVREQVEALLGPDMPYDIADEGLLVWPGHAYGTEVVYDLSKEGTLEGKTRGESLRTRPASLSAVELVFRRQTIGWQDWVDAWKEGAVTKVVSGPAILPAPRVLSAGLALISRWRGKGAKIEAPRDNHRPTSMTSRRSRICAAVVVTAAMGGACHHGTASEDRVAPALPSAAPSPSPSMSATAMPTATATSTTTTPTATTTASSVPPDPDPPVFSRAFTGSRLRAKRITTGPGATVSVGLHDTLLDFDCEVTIMSDGSERCAPVARLSSADWAPVFLDAACTMPGMITAPCDEESPTYAVVMDVPDAAALACGTSSFHAVHVGAESPTFYEQKNGSCVDASTLYTSVTPRPRAFATEDFPISSLVLAVATSFEPRGPRLQAEVKTFEDGARMVTRNYRDTTHDGACDMTTGQRDEFITCFPRSGRALSGEGWFSDPSCKQKVLDNGPGSSCAEAPAWAVGMSGAGSFCPDGQSYFLLGPPAPPPAYYLLDGCKPATGVPTGDTFQSVGAAIPLADIPSAKVLPVGTAAMPVRGAVAEDGTVVEFHGFVDSLGNACSPLRLGDETYCAPLKTPEWNIYGPFSDADCTKPVVQIFPPGGAKSGGCVDGPVLPSFVFEGVAIGACPSLHKVRPVTQTPSSAPLFSVDPLSGKCFPGSSSGPDVTYYETGELVSAESVLPRLGVSIE